MSKAKRKAATQSALAFWPTLEKPAHAPSESTRVCPGSSGTAVRTPTRRSGTTASSTSSWASMISVAVSKGARDEGEGDGRGRDGQPRAGRVASGEEFVVCYPLPFLEYYWHANRGELSADARSKLFPSEVAEVSEDAVADKESGAVRLCPRRRPSSIRRRRRARPSSTIWSMSPARSTFPDRDAARTQSSTSAALSCRLGTVARPSQASWILMVASTLGRTAAILCALGRGCSSASRGARRHPLGYHSYGVSLQRVGRLERGIPPSSLGALRGARHRSRSQQFVGSNP